MYKKITYKSMFTAIMLGCLSITPALAGGVQVAASTPFAKDSMVREAVKNECELQTKLPNFLLQYAGKNGVDVVLVDDNLNKRKGRVLLLEITNVQGAGGGAWSGAKSVQVKGKLYDHGKLIGDFIASRASGGGFFGAYKGTCSILGRCVKTLGSDIAKWLKHPSKGAHLG